MRDLTRWIVFLAILVQASLLSGGEPDAKPGNELSAEEFMLANALWTLLHETAHAVIDELDILFLGSEEDAADQLATIALLRGDPDFDLSEKISAADAVIAAAGHPADDETRRLLRRRTAQKLRTQRLTGLSFPPDRQILRKPPLRRIRTTEGVTVTYPDEVNAVTVQRVRNLEGAGEKITITTDRIVEDSVVSDRAR